MYDPARDPVVTPAMAAFMFYNSDLEIRIDLEQETVVVYDKTVETEIEIPEDVRRMLLTVYRNKQLP